MSDLAALNRATYLSERAADFVELNRIHFMARGGNHLQIARARGSSGRVLDMVSKGAIAPGSTTDPNYTALLQQLAEAFLGSLGNFSSFDAILNSGGFLRVPRLRTRVAVVTLAASGYGVEEGNPKPISKLSLNLTEMQHRKAVGIFILTSELLRSVSPGAADFITNELRRAVGKTTDDAFVNSLIANTGAPSVPSTGTIAANFITDLGNALELISYGATSKLFLLVPPALNRRLITLRDSGGPIMVNGIVGTNVKTVCSDSLSDTAILLDSTQIAVSADEVTMDETDQASLEIDDAPTGTLLRSMYQENATAIRATRPFACQVLRDDCLCLITGVSTTA
jgi:hypothetical protein